MASSKSKMQDRLNKLVNNLKNSTQSAKHMLENSENRVIEAKAKKRKFEPRSNLNLNQNPVKRACMRKTYIEKIGVASQTQTQPIAGSSKKKDDVPLNKISFGSKSTLANRFLKNDRSQCSQRVSKESEDQVPKVRNNTNRPIVVRKKTEVRAKANKTDTLKIDSNISENQINDVRNLVEQELPMEWDDTVAIPYQSSKPIQSVIYLVVDTNVLIKDLKLVQQLKKSTIKGMTCVLIIPWQVLKELDYLKDRKNTIIARSASSFLLQCVSEAGSNVFGEPPESYDKPFPGFEITVPDDRIIKCSLQIKSDGHNVILLTNDKNMALKSHVCGVNAISAAELNVIAKQNKIPVPISETELPPKKSNILHEKIHRLIIIFKNFLTKILESHLKLKYGNLWQWYSPDAQPWAMKSLLKSLLNNFETNEKMMLHARSLLTFLNTKFDAKESEKLGKDCHYIAMSFLPDYSEEVCQFEKDAAFFKKAMASADSNYQLECANSAIEHLDMYAEKINNFCTSISHPKIPFVSLPQLRFNLKINKKELPSALETLQIVVNCLNRLTNIVPGNVTSNETIALYNAVLKCLKQNVNEMFSNFDLVEFFNMNTYRAGLQGAINFLQNSLVFLQNNQFRK